MGVFVFGFFDFFVGDGGWVGFEGDGFLFFGSFVFSDNGGYKVVEIFSNNRFDELRSELCGS